MEQLIYTYCKSGIGSPNSDFKIYTCSAEAQKDEITDVNNGICRYCPPLPEYSEKNGAPASFKYIVSENGMCSVSKASFIGNITTDSGLTEANYLCHVFTVKKDKISFRPAMFFNSRLFVSKITDKERDSENVAELLPPVKVSAFEQSCGCKTSDIIDFINANRERIGHLKMIIAALIESGASQKRIIICDKQENIPLYIAAATLCFPTGITADISFSSYEYNPDDCGNVLICGVVPAGTAYTHDFAENNSDKYYIFDFESGILPEINVPDNSFFKLIDFAFGQNFDVMSEFNEYIDAIGLNRLNSDIYSAAEVYTVFKAQSNDISEELYEEIDTFLSRNYVARRMFTPPGNTAVKILADIGLVGINSLAAKNFIRFLKDNNMSLFEYRENYTYTYWNGVLENIENVGQEAFTHIIVSMFIECEKDFTLATEVFMYFAERLENADYTYLETLCEAFFEYALSTGNYFERANYEEVLKYIISAVTDRDDIPNTTKLIIDEYEKKIESISDSGALLYSITRIYEYKRDHNIAELPNRTPVLLAVNKILNGEDASSVCETVGVLDFRCIEEAEAESYIFKMAEYIASHSQSSVAYDCFLIMLSKAEPVMMYETCTKAFTQGFLKTCNSLPVLSLIYRINSAGLSEDIVSECEGYIINAASKASAKHYNEMCKTAYSSFPDDFREHWRGIYSKITELRGSTLWGKIKLMLGI